MKIEFGSHLGFLLVLILYFSYGKIHAQDKITPSRPDVSPKKVSTGVEGKLSSGDHTCALLVGDLERRYRIYVPKKYDSSKATPVVIVYHGGGGNPESMIRLTGMNAKADEAGFIVIYPYGTGNFANSLLTFNGGECCGYAIQHNIDDVSFTRKMLDDLAQMANVDADRVFATGLSNGGIMSHYLASELSDRIAAIAPVGGPLMMEAPRNLRPVPVMHFHGTADAFAPFKGGYGKGFLGRSKVTSFRSVDHTIQKWVKANGCTTEPESVTLPDVANDSMKVIRRTWRGGKDGSEVVLIEIEGGGHTWPGRKPIVSILGESTMDISANDMMWEFFQRHPRRQVKQVNQDGRE
jgi:polyhydroxybutyrate depolymerase